MNKINSEELQKNIEQKAATRQRKKKPTMKKSGVSVKKLQKLIINKGNKS